MKIVSISEAKNGLSALLREIRGGASVVITDRGVPVAHIVPPPFASGLPASTIELVQQGEVTLPQRQPSVAWLDHEMPVLAHGASVVDALLDERQSEH